MKVNYKHSLVVKILLCLVLALLLVALTFNIYSAITFIHCNTIKAVVHLIISALIVCLIVLNISVMFFSCYKTKGDNLILQFGFLRFKKNINDILSLVSYIKDDKLVAYTENDCFSIIIFSEQFNYFVTTLTKINPNISYVISSDIL